MSDKIQEYISDMTEYGSSSDCCGAEIIMGDICSDCREHCEPVFEEEDDDDPDGYVCMSCGHIQNSGTGFGCDKCSSPVTEWYH